MKTWNERVTYAREQTGLEKAEFARRVGVKAPTVTDWESGEIKNLSAENLISISSVTGFRPEWIQTGRGPMRLDLTAAILALPPPPKETEPPLTPRQRALLGYFDGLTEAQQDQAIREFQEKKRLNEEVVEEFLARRGKR